MVLNVIDIDLAEFILHHRCKDGKVNVRDPVNIRSCVSCISEVIRIKDSQLFLVKLNANVNIIVKIEKLIHWHEKLELYKEFIFTGVRPTTIQKGSTNAHRVYAATEQSELIIPGDSSFVQVNYMDLLNQHSCDDIEQITGLKQGDKVCGNLFSYQGTVTRILDCNMCVYELDDTVRLYASKVPAVHKFSHLHIGATVIVQNAHHRVSQECPKLSIYSCMLSSVKVISKEKKCNSVKASNTLKRLLFLSDQSQRQLDQIFDVRQILKKQFVAQYGERQMEKIFSVITQSKEISEMVCKVTPRNVLDEFLSTPHKCLLQDSSMIQCKKQLVTADDVNNSIPSINKDCLEWQCMKVPGESTHVITGVLDTNEQNGEIFLKDSTGSLGVLISSCHGNNEGTAKCSALCDCSNQVPCEKFPCSYIHPCCIGKTIAVPVFLLVSETLFKERRLSLNILNKQNTTCEDVCDKYVVFDMRDAIFISHSKLISNVVSAVAPYKVLSIGSTKHDLQGKDGTCTLNTNSNVIENSMQNQKPCKQNIAIEDQSNHKISTLHKHVREDGSFYFCRKDSCSVQSSILLSDTINSVPENSDRSSRGLSTKNDGFVQKATFRVKPISTRKRLQVDSEPVIKQNKVFRTETLEVAPLGILAGNLNGCGSVKLESKTNDAENGTQAKDYDEVILYIENKGSLISGEVDCRFNAECVLIDSETNQKVILEFTKGASRWYHMLYPKSVYKLSVQGTTVPVLSLCVTSDKVQKILLKNNTKKCFKVHSEVIVHQTWESNTVVSDLVLDTIEDVLNTSNTEQFVSFEGNIIGRHLVKPGFGPRYNMEDKGATGMFSRLHVQHQDKKNDIWVYLNDDTIISYRGLIPGARVRFNGLERKVSKFSNVYCRLIAVSSVNVLALSMDRSKELLLKDDQSPVVCLSELWTLKSFRGQIFQCVCDVEKVLKVSLKCLCEKCGSQIQHGTCSNKSCDSGLGHRFLARASAIFDDGTCVAMVTLTGSSVQQMLQLSDDQWRHLEDEVRMSGEIFVQQCNPATCTDMEKFIYFLCDNHSVKKTWLLIFRTKCTLDINSINFDEFSVKNFDTGTSRISTKCLPFLQLECVRLTTFDPVCWSMKHILNV